MKLVVRVKDAITLIAARELGARNRKTPAPPDLPTANF
jgi:hypothetical protein